MAATDARWHFIAVQRELRLADVVEMTTFHVDFDEHLGTFMKVKDRYVNEPYPAWTAIGVSALAFGSLVEIKVVARVGAGG